MSGFGNKFFKFSNKLWLLLKQSNNFAFDNLAAAWVFWLELIQCQCCRSPFVLPKCPLKCCQGTFGKNLCSAQCILANFGKRATGDQWREVRQRLARKFEQLRLIHG